MRAEISLRRCAAAVLMTVSLPVGAAAQLAAPVAQLSMDEAVRLALARNQPMQAQRLAIDASKADEITAGLKPNLGVSFGVAGFTPFTPSTLDLDFLKNGASYSGSAAYLFERGGKRDNRIALARATTAQTGYTVRDAERQLRFQTEQAFVGVLFAKSTLELAQQNLKSFTDVVDLNRRRVTAGDLAEGDFYKISLQQLQFEQDASAAEVALEQARANLRQLVGFETVTESFEPIGTLAYSAHALTP